MRYRRAMSTIVVTLILTLLVLVAIGIVWVVARNIIEGGVEDVSLGGFTINLEIKNAYIEENNLIVDVKRNSGQGNLVGIKFIFYNGTNSEDVEEMIVLKELGEKSFSFDLDILNLSGIKEISIAPIYKSDSEKEVFGNVVDSFVIVNEEGCNPNCIGKECGDDGCEGSCGDCTGEEECINGICEPWEEDLCQDECDFENHKICSNQSSYKICGNYDFDSCLELGDVTECSSGKTCYSGSCVKQRVLRTLAVVVDFQDQKLEDYTGEGVNSISDIQDILNKMEAHWEWMSVGIEVQFWNIIRVTLPKDFTPDAYHNWWEFRNAVVNLAKQKVDDELYDNDNDGVIDNIFALVSSGENDVLTGYNYIFGGASKNEEVRIFMDPQGSLSIKNEVYGNFNHELGHGHTVKDDFWGLPDIYGEYDTLGYLSLMSNSWPLPAFGFSAYDRYLLEWIKPEGLSSTTKDILLLPAEENLQAIKIVTDNPKEFFLVEYRKKPQSGYGSSVGYPNYNGLAIYHIDEEQGEEGMEANRDLPPLIYLEPADGENEFPSAPEENDFWFPDNSVSTGIFSAKKYNSDDVIFRVENIRWSGQGIMFDVIFT